MTERKAIAPMHRMRVVVTIIVLFAVLGAVWYGFSEEVYQRIWRNLVDRIGGPMTFRLILQPVVSLWAAVKDGIGDARAGRSPYLYVLFSEKEGRSERLAEGLTSTALVFLMALAVDLAYQFMVLKTFYPGEAVVVAVTLALVPYFIARGPIRRLASRSKANS